MFLSPLIHFGISFWTYEDWQGQVYKKQYAKSVFTRECQRGGEVNAAESRN